MDAKGQPLVEADALQSDREELKSFRPTATASRLPCFNRTVRN